MERLLIIILLNLVFYFKTLRFGYVSDDLALVNLHKNKGFLRDLWDEIRARNYSNSQREHLISLIVHTVNCSLIYWVFGANYISFWAAMLFAVNPVTLFGGVWLSGKGYAVSLSLALLMWKMQVWGVIPYLVSILFSIGVFAMPLIFIGTKYWWMLLTIPIFLFIHLKCNNGAKAFKYRVSLLNIHHKKISPKKIIIAIKTFAYYFLHCLFPRRLGLYHSFLFTYGLQDKDNEHWLKKDKWFWGGLAMVGLVVYCLINNFSNTTFGFWWFCLGIALWLNLFMANQVIADRYIYLATAGLMLAVSNVLVGFPNLLKYLFIYYLIRNWLHINAFKNDDLFLDYNISDINHPDQIFVWTLKGDKERALARPFQALESWCRGLKLRPTDTRLHFYIAKTLAELGFFKEAEMHLDEMEKNPLYDIESGITSAIPTLKAFIKQGRNGKVAVCR